MAKTCVVCVRSKRNRDASTRRSFWRLPGNARHSTAKQRKKLCEFFGLQDLIGKKDTRNDFICSDHFVGGYSTGEPTLNVHAGGFSKRASSIARMAAAVPSTPRRSPPRSQPVKLPTPPKRKAPRKRVPVAPPLPSPDVLVPGPADQRCSSLLNDIVRLSDELQVTKALLQAAEARHVVIPNPSESPSVTESTCRTVVAFRYSSMQDDNQFQYYSGLCRRAFDGLFEALQVPTRLLYHGENEVATPSAKRGRRRVLSQKDELFITLARLRHDFTLQDLAFRSGVSTSTLSTCFITWVKLLYERLSAINWAPTLAEMRPYSPLAFQNHFRNTRFIIDCTEIKVQVPADRNAQSATWSSYKQSNTFKGLVAVTPNSAVAFVSPLFAGSVSDVDLFSQSGIIDLLNPGDRIMVDRGFSVKNLLLSKNVGVYMPPSGKFSPFAFGDVYAD